MTGYIYLITDTTNGMKYTGKHHYHIEGQLDPNYHGSGTIIKNIYKKRPETLKEEYIKTCYSEEEMCSDEQYYIKLFKTLWPNGYNLTEGGDGLIPCEETRRKLRDANKGKKLSEETKKKMSEAQKGEKNHFFGKHHSEETLLKLIAANKGRHHTEEAKKKISDKIKGRTSPNKGKHPSEETRRKMSISRKGKHHSEESKRKMSAAQKGKHPSEEARRKMSLAKKGKPNVKLSKPVIQLTLDGEFVREWESAKEAGRNGFDSSAVTKCCRGKLKSHKGFIFQFKD